ncbi:MAG: hypothetical protein WCR51_05840 [Planctomycetia bacterium]
MRSLPIIVALAATLLPLWDCAVAPAAETIIVTEDPGAASLEMGSAEGCGCRNAQRPPWHGNVQGAACGPACGTGHGGVFHANPCGQLHLRRYAREHCMTLPPCFPRLHGWLAEGQMPTPPPPSTPRCHQCGAVIEGGF